MKNWYLLYCKRGEQQRAKLHLENQGVECFYPEVTFEKILRGKKQEVTEPLFPSYVFICFDFEAGPAFSTIRSTRGVIDFVRFGAQPKALDPELIEHLREVDPDQVIQSVLPQQGQVVRIKTGQFAGIDAIYQEPDGETRSILLVNMISKPVPLSVENRDLELG
jgi:transcriptional antiterminator RfaH